MLKIKDFTLASKILWEHVSPVLMVLYTSPALPFLRLPLLPTLLILNHPHAPRAAF